LIALGGDSCLIHGKTGPPDRGMWTPLLSSSHASSFFTVRKVSGRRVLLHFCTFSTCFPHPQFSPPLPPATFSCSSPFPPAGMGFFSSGFCPSPPSSSYLFPIFWTLYNFSTLFYLMKGGRGAFLPPFSIFWVFFVSRSSGG